MELDRVSN